MSIGFIMMRHHQIMTKIIRSLKSYCNLFPTYGKKQNQHTGFVEHTGLSSARLPTRGMTHLELTFRNSIV
jgi:hypothetical protein